MTSEELSHVRALALETESKVLSILEALSKVAPSEPSSGPPVAPEPVPRAVVTIGTASAQKGGEAALEVRVTSAAPIAGVWLNLQHSPRLEFLSATSKVKSKAFRVEKAPDHFRALVMFSTDLATESAFPDGGLVQFAPGTLLLVANYRVKPDAPLGHLPVAGGRSGAATPGVSRVSWPTLLLNWGSGGIVPLVEDGYVEVAP